MRTSKKPECELAPPNAAPTTALPASTRFGVATLAQPARPSWPDEPSPHVYSRSAASHAAVA